MVHVTTRSRRIFIFPTDTKSLPWLNISANTVLFRVSIVNLDFFVNSKRATMVLLGIRTYECSDIHNKEDLECQTTVAGRAEG